MDNADFGLEAFAEKTINVGTQLIHGCSGKAQGQNHINPDGSIGGFVANTATVEKSVYIGPSVSICGNTKIMGSTVLSSGLPLLNYNGSEVWESTINNTTMNVGSRIFISHSSINNIHLLGDPWDVWIVASTVSDSNFSFNSYRGLTIQFSTVTNTTTSGEHFSASYSTIVGMDFQLENSIGIMGDYIQYYGISSGLLSDWPFY